MNLKDCIVAFETQRGNHQTAMDKTHVHHNGAIAGLKRSWDVGIKSDGTGDVIVFEIPALKDRSVSMWFQCDDTAKISTLLIPTASSTTFQVKITGNNIIFYNSVTSLLKAFTSNLWTHFTGVYDYYNENIYMYLNGELVADNLLAGSADSYGGVYWIGQSGANGIIGHLDHIRIYEKALTAAEVKKEYYRTKLQRAKILIKSQR